MGAHSSYEDEKKLVVKGLILLAVVTVVEVIIALVGKGYVIEGFFLPTWLMYLAMIGLSLYKAYFIVYYFMHMAYEVPGLRMSVILPMLLLVWAVIAFFSEGKFWHDSRKLIQDKNAKDPVGSTDVKNEIHGSDVNLDSYVFVHIG